MGEITNIFEDIKIRAEEAIMEISYDTIELLKAKMSEKRKRFDEISNEKTILSGEIHNISNMIESISLLLNYYNKEGGL